MKVKFRFDLKTIREALVAHVEKLVLVGGALGFLVLVASALGFRPPFPAEELRQSANLASEHIRKGRPEASVQQLKREDYEAKARRIREATSVEPYQHEVAWDPPVFRLPRPQVPQIYAISSLRGGTGSGAMVQPAKAPAAPAGASPLPVSGSPHVVGQRWVVLTGLIDFAKQMESFREAFSGTIVSRAAAPPQPGRPAGVLPEFLMAAVQRVEVDDEGQFDAEKWEWVDPRGQLEIIRQSVLLAGSLGPGQAPSGDVDPSFQTGSPLVTAPLPRVHNYRWGPEVAYPPKIVFQAELFEQLLKQYEAEKAQPGAAASATPEGTAPPPDPNEPPGLGDLLKQPTAPGPGGPMPAPGPGANAYDKDKDEEGGLPLPGAGGVPSIAGRPALDAATLARLRPPGKLESLRLFRFFDFSVMPGKRYRYRVKLVLANPAQRVPVAFHELLPEELDAKKKYLLSEFSEPSEVIAIPSDTRLLVRTVKSPRTVGELASNLPAANLLLVRFDAATGAEGTLETLDVPRGQLVNYIQTVEITRPEEPPLPPPGGNPRERERERPRPVRPNATNREVFKTPYYTESLVLDLQGGDRLTRDPKLTRPGSLLLVGSDGRLTVRYELEDQPNADRLKPPEPPSTTTPRMQQRMMKRGGRGGPAMGGGGKDDE